MELPAHQLSMTVLMTPDTANFSGKVDIFDLTLVGGNWGSTSASVYGTWAP